MKEYFFNLSAIAMIIFGGTFFIKYLKTGELLKAQLIVFIISFLIFIYLLVTKIIRKK